MLSGRSPGTSGFSLDPPRVESLGRERALELGMAEMEMRGVLLAEEQDSRLTMLYQLVAKISLSGLEEKLNACSSSAWHTISLLRKEEEEVRTEILAEFAHIKALLRRVELGEVDSEQFSDLINLEELQRKKMCYMEDRTFQDMRKLLRVISMEASEEARLNAIRQQAEGNHCVRLFDGCPFINPRHCPFHSASWIDPKSLVQQHFQRKYPRLKYNKHYVEKSYQQIVAQRFEKMQKVDCRLFVSRVEKGLAPKSM